MIRSVLGVVLGYIIMAVLVLVTFTVVYIAMGTDRAFQPGSYEVSTLWLVASMVLGLVAAVIGGFACAVIAKGGRAPFALAIVVLVFGLLLAIPAFGSAQDDRPTIRAGGVSNIEAMQNARQPKWVVLVNPVIGALGVVLGAGLRGGKDEKGE